MSRSGRGGRVDGRGGGRCGRGRALGGGGGRAGTAVADQAAGRRRGGRRLRGRAAARDGRGGCRHARGCVGGGGWGSGGCRLGQRDGAAAEHVASVDVGPRTAAGLWTATCGCFVRLQRRTKEPLLKPNQMRADERIVVSYFFVGQFGLREATKSKIRPRPRARRRPPSDRRAVPKWAMFSLETNNSIRS